MATRVVRILLLLACGLATAAPSSSAATIAVNAGGGGMNPQALSDMRQAGVRLVRIDASWGSLQPRPGPIVTTGADRTMRLMVEAGVRWFPVLAYGPGWSGDPFVPGEPEDFAMVARALVARYGPGGSFFVDHPHLPYLPVRAIELYNEPNLPHFWHAPRDPGRYARMARAALREVRAANPQVKVLVGSLVRGGPYSPNIYLRDMHRADRRLIRDADGVSFHPYGPEVGFTVDDTRAFVRQARGYGARRVWLTEFGAPITPAFSEVEQFRFVRGQLRAFRCDPELRRWLGPLFPFAWDGGEFRLGAQARGLLRLDCGALRSARWLATG